MQPILYMKNPLQLFIILSGKYLDVISVTT